MGWADCGTDSKWRPIGYAHEATCDHPGCTKQIDRGLAYACGGMHGSDDTSCEGYFCDDHLYLAEVDGVPVQLCQECTAKLVEELESALRGGKALLDDAWTERRELEKKVQGLESALAGEKAAREHDRSVRFAELPRERAKAKFLHELLLEITEKALGEDGPAYFKKLEQELERAERERESERDRATRAEAALSEQSLNIITMTHMHDGLRRSNEMLAERAEKAEAERDEARAELGRVYRWAGCRQCHHDKTTLCGACVVDGKVTKFAPKWNALAECGEG